MPLVDYGSSDESDEETSSDEKQEENVEDEDKKTESKEKEGSSDQSTVNKTINVSDPKLFANLPMPKSSVSLGDDALKLLNKSKYQPVKIMLPSLSELDSGDNEDTKKKKPSTKGSGLFALLPAPKNVTNLVPNSIKTKMNSMNKPKLIPKKQVPLPLSKVFHNTSEKKNHDDEEDNEENPTSFFFSSTDDNLPTTDVDDVKFNHLGNTKSISIDIATDTITSNIDTINSSISIEDEGPSYSENIAAHTELIHIQNNVEGGNLDDEAIEKLCGTRARKRKGELSEEVIDINVDSMVGDAYKWLSKDLTKEHEHRGFKKAKNLSVVERRKHQITYLASQAKEKEMELRNQWANSRMTRKQTQSKYGF